MNNGSEIPYVAIRSKNLTITSDGKLHFGNISDQDIEDYEKVYLESNIEQHLTVEAIITGEIAGTIYYKNRVYKSYAPFFRKRRFK